MFLYNETIGIDQSIEQEWLLWMREQHMPQVMETKMFVSAKIYKVLHDNDDGNVSYSIQYFTASIDNVQQYLEVFAPALVEEHRLKFKDKHVAFRTLLQEV
jgi:hypothetical protein